MGFIMEILIHIIGIELLLLSLRCSSSWNVPCIEEWGETAVFAGYALVGNFELKTSSQGGGLWIEILSQGLGSLIHICIFDQSPHPILWSPLPSPLPQAQNYQRDNKE